MDATEDRMNSGFSEANSHKRYFSNRYVGKSINPDYSTLKYSIPDHTKSKVLFCIILVILQHICSGGKLPGSKLGHKLQNSKN